MGRTPWASQLNFIVINHLVYLQVSPNEVEVWEAVLTFLFFPILTVIAYTADKGWLDAVFCRKKGGDLAADKQRQIELGSFQPGESTYRTSPFLLYLDVMSEHFCRKITYLELTLPPPRRAKN